MTGIFVIPLSFGGFGCVLLMPCLGCFMWPFAIAGLGFRYLRINILVKFGHPLRKPFCTAFISVDIFGLHNDSCANSTLFARVFTECVNIARLTTSLATFVASVGGCEAQPSQGPSHGRI